MNRKQYQYQGARRTRVRLFGTINQSSIHLLRIIVLGLVEPLQPQSKHHSRYTERETHLEERLTGLPNHLTRLLVHVLLRDVGAPSLNDVLVEDIGLVKRHEDLGYGRYEVWAVEARETLDAAEERLLVLLARDELMTKSIKI